MRYRKPGVKLFGWRSARRRRVENAVVAFAKAMPYPPVRRRVLALGWASGDEQRSVVAAPEESVGSVLRRLFGPSDLEPPVLLAVADETAEDGWVLLRIERWSR